MHRSTIPWASSLAFLVTLVGPTVAHAQSAAGVATETSIDSQTYWPAAGPGEHLSLRSSTISQSFGVGFGLISNFSRLPLRTCAPGASGALGNCAGQSSPGLNNAVDYAFTTDFGFSLGLFNFLQVMVAVPVVVAQSGIGASSVLRSSPQLSDTSLRDLRFDVAISIIRRERTLLATGFGLRVDLGGAAPFGDDKNFESSGGWTFDPMVIADYRTRFLTFTLNAGARVRQSSQFANLSVGSQAVAAGAVAFHPAVDSFFTASVEVFSLLPLTSQQGFISPTNTEGFVGARFATDTAHDVELLAGVGFPMDSNPLTPAWRGILGLSYAPHGNDTDHDGVPDAVDRCPRVPEDRDNFQDDDGCPDPDNDNDGIPDTADRCPNEPEDVDGYQDQDGCPDPDNDSDGVLDADDQCPDVAAGPHPDPARPGCPAPDTDHDAVLDTDDRCPETPAGEHPDPRRPGCPLPDADHDGVADADDRCPDVPAGEHPDAYRRGCPDTDRDHDGVPDDHDRCPTEPETINGVQDDDGCPDAGPEHVTWEHAEPDVLRFDRPVVVPMRAATLPAPMLSLFVQAAQRIRARGGEVAHVYVEVEATAGPAGATEAARQAQLVADVLLAHGVPQRAIGSGAFQRPAPATPPHPPTAPALPGRVHIHVERAGASAPTPPGGAPATP